MALDQKNLFKIGGADPAFFIYKAGADTAAAVQTAGYFNLATDQLHKGDVIAIVGANFTTIDMASVTSASGAAAVTLTGAEGVA